jgi:threonine aldolase
MATLYGKVTANVYGTPEDAARMSAMFARGMGIAQTMDGFFAAAGTATSDLAKKATEAVDELVDGAAERLRRDPPD